MQGDDSKLCTGQLMQYFSIPEKSPPSTDSFLDLLVPTTLSPTPLTGFQDRDLNNLQYKVCFVQLVQHVMLCSHEFWSFSDVQQGN